MKKTKFNSPRVFINGNTELRLSGGETVDVWFQTLITKTKRNWAFDEVLADFQIEKLVVVEKEVTDITGYTTAMEQYLGKNIAQEVEDKLFKYLKSIRPGALAAKCGLVNKTTATRKIHIPKKWFVRGGEELGKSKITRFWVGNCSWVGYYKEKSGWKADHIDALIKSGYKEITVAQARKIVNK